APPPGDSVRVVLSADVRMAVVHRSGGRIEFWDLARKKLIRKVQDPWFTEVQFIPPRLVGVGPGDVLALVGEKILGISAPRGTPSWLAKPEGEWQFSTAALSRDGKRLAATSRLTPSRTSRPRTTGSGCGTSTRGSGSAPGIWNPRRSSRP